MIVKIDKIQELLHVPNIDESTETAINNMKILNLLVDLRAEAQQLILCGVSHSQVFEAYGKPFTSGRDLWDWLEDNCEIRLKT